MKDLKAVDCRGKQINQWDTVFYADSKNIDLKVAVVFAILRDGEILLEKEPGNYMQRDGKSVGLVGRGCEEIKKCIEEVPYVGDSEGTPTVNKDADDEVIRKNTPMIYGIPLKKWLKNNYPKKGMTQKDIAKEAGVTQPIISFMVKKLGLTRPYGQNKPKEESKTIDLTQEQMDWLDSNYVSSRLADRDILKLGLFKGCNKEAFKDYVRR